MSHFITKFQPFEWIMDVIRMKIGNRLVPSLILNCLNVLITCHKCSALWIGILCGGIWVGLVTSYLAYLYGWLIEPKIEVYKNPI